MAALWLQFTIMVMVQLPITTAQQLESIENLMRMFQTLQGDFKDMKRENQELKAKVDDVERRMQERQLNYHTLFLATISQPSIAISNSDPIRFDSAPINPGGNYDTTQGTYTAPYNGYYQFSVVQRSDISQARFYLLVDNKQYAYHDMDYDESDGSGSIYPTGSITINMELRAGQTVAVQNPLSTHVFGTKPNGLIQSWFTGYLMYVL